MKVFAVVFLLVVAATASTLKEQGEKFQEFKLKHGKTFKNQVEETKRFNIFKENLRRIQEHNALYERGLKSYKQGVTRFTDMTQDEFRASLAVSSSNKPYIHTTKYVKTGEPLPNSTDWRRWGYVTRVKDQGNCGSGSWAFSVTGATEGAYKRTTGKLVSLSEQQLIDCSTDINFGCDGGFSDPTFPYIETYGLESEETYPFNNSTNEECQYSSSQIITKVSNHVSIETADEDALQEAVAFIGPVSVAVNGLYLSRYNSGIISGACPDTTLNHFALAVGYGTEGGLDYWIVKNSWGADWGEDGYFRIRRGNNMCGIAQDAVYPVIN